MPRNAAQTMPESASAVVEKIALRRRMRALRESRPPEVARERGLRAQSLLTDTEQWKNAASVALYAARTGEISLDALMELAWLSGRVVYLPRIRCNERGVMDFVPCGCLAELESASFGLREPKADLPGFGAGDVGKTFRPDLLLMPGLAFDRRGMRLGFGGGYYDRFLLRLTDCLCVGVCFEFQVVETLPVETWDRPAHYICTEERFRKVFP
ncbi:MAG: 5-formyltetrahydrofolate cyclo-ligase [Desulfovibrio sp.]|nr:5-formyltetrahydrofolate cyclo-ligase [Desulfovibrio sp.]